MRAGAALRAHERGCVQVALTWLLTRTMERITVVACLSKSGSRGE